jgi:DNA-binding MarR family transcriptional regulator
MQASRAQSAAMLACLVGRGFDDLTPTIASVIPLLDAAGARSTALAQRSGVTKQAMSQLVRLLEERNYVEQIPDPTDTRAKLVRLTKRGVTMRAACFKVRLELQAAVVKSLGPRNSKRLQEDLKTLTAVLAHVSEKASTAEMHPERRRRLATRALED